MIGGSYRLSKWQKDLPPQHMKVIGWSGTVHHDPVTVIKLLDGKVFSVFLKQTNSVLQAETNTAVYLDFA